MWSGPRNISTAMMRSWGSRSDTSVTDEPFYASYLKRTGVDHPGSDEVIESDPRDWKEVAEWLTGEVPGGREIWYQKQMTHHVSEEMMGEWLEGLDHAFLIRDPALVIASFSKVVEDPSLDDLGFEQQLRIFDWVRERSGRIPPVIDSDDVLRAPRQMLERLCDALDVPFSEEMLEWKSGPRSTDGVWARHWYGAVERSTGFEPWEEKEIVLRGALRKLEQQARSAYESLAAFKLT